MLLLIREIEKVGGYWCIENPTGSFLWATPELRALQCKHFSVSIHQCEYHLRPPDYYVQRGPKLDLRTRKATTILTNLEALKALEVRCSGGHQHVQALGSIMCNGKLTSRAQAAGSYPASLCDAWAKLVGDHVERC